MAPRAKGQRLLPPALSMAVRGYRTQTILSHIRTIYRLTGPKGAIHPAICVNGILQPTTSICQIVSAPNRNPRQVARFRWKTILPKQRPHRSRCSRDAKKPRSVFPESSPALNGRGRALPRRQPPCSWCAAAGWTPGRQALPDQSTCRRRLGPSWDHWPPRGCSARA